jgi:acetoin utilization protein AcuC
VDACLIYSAALTAYDFGPEHPLRPQRFALATSLMRAYDLLAAPRERGRGRLDVIEPVPAGEPAIRRAHDADYVESVKEASAHPEYFFPPRLGLGSADTPVFPRMHEVSALVAGATLTATREVLEGGHRRALSVAGGLHHAHRGRAAGFCVYNDCAIAIADALATHPDLRVLYIDIDAHHGDGVQEAFYAEPRVLTISVHESGEYLYPGSGWPDERGEGAGAGFAVNVPLPQGATDECFAAAFEHVVEPAARRFAPGLLVAQCGADAHHADPLTSLGLTIGGHAALGRRMLALADELCFGRLVACGGGGYGWQHVVPRCWTILAAQMADVALADVLPEPWRREARRASGVEIPFRLTEDHFAASDAERARLLDATLRTCDEVALCHHL